MLNRPYTIQIHSHPSQPFPSLDTTFGRVNVLLGANGSGKSRLLQVLAGAIYQQLNCPQSNVLFIEGGRVLKAIEAIRIGGRSSDAVSTMEEAQKKYLEARHQGPDKRLASAIQILLAASHRDRLRHSDAVVEWQEKGSVGLCPTRDPQPFAELLQLFNSVFPSLHLVLDDAGSLVAEKSGFRYPLSMMSDGEKQVLYLLAEIGFISPKNSVLLIDEPELNLHANLSCKLWDTLEELRPDAVFIYATHSVTFAMRQNVEKLLVLSQNRREPVEVENVQQIDGAELREFLGAVPAILSTSAALAVEGRDNSFDRPFYRWLIGRNDFEIIPLEDCEAVIAATTRTGIWDRIASDVKIVGVIDRDMRSDQECIDGKCVVLPLHEAESYLCHPDLVVSLASKLKTSEVPLQSEIIDLIGKHLNSRLFRVAASRISRKLKMTITVAPEGRVISEATTEEEMKLAVKVRIRQQRDEMERRLGEEAVFQSISEELERCRCAIIERNVEELLILCPAKEVLPAIARRLGVSVDAYKNAVFNHLAPQEFQHLDRLKLMLQDLLHN